MPVVDQYTDAFLANGVPSKLLRALAQGTKLGVMYATFAIAATDSSGSVYRVFKSVDPSLVLLHGIIGCSAITGSTSADLGLYNASSGVVVNKNVFLSAQTLATAVAISPTTGISALGAVSNNSRGNRIWEHAAATIQTMKSEYDIAVTLNTSGSTAGTVSVMLFYAQAS